MDAKVKKAATTASFVVLFFMSFLFFVYFTFPYGVVKEFITAQLNRNFGYNFRVERLAPSLPVGIRADGVTIASKVGNRNVKFKSFSVNVSILKLLIGKLGVNASIFANTGGKIDFDMSMGIFSILLDKNFMPSYVELNAKEFAFDECVDFALAEWASSPGVNALVAPLLSQVSFLGNLNGSFGIDLNAKDPTQSKGDINLTVKDAVLMVKDSQLNIQENFEKFLVKANMNRGSLVIDSNSGFKSKGLGLALNGKIDLKEIFAASLLNLNVDLKLDDDLKESFGFIVDAAMGGQNGQAKVQILGTLAQPRTVTL